MKRSKVYLLSDTNKDTNKYTIQCFEPSQQAQVWAPLISTAQKYEKYYDGMYLCNLAIADSFKLVEFRDDGSAGSSLHELKPLNANEKKTYVRTTSIIGIIERISKNTKHIILKFNIEGAEYDVMDVLIDNIDLLDERFELWLDFHGHQFGERKWEYFKKEMLYIEKLRKKIRFYDVEFMSGFHRGYKEQDLKKHNITKFDLLDMYVQEIAG